MQMDFELLKKACAADRPLLGVHLSFLTPEVVEYCGVLGFRWVFLDAEHQPVTPDNCQRLVCAAQLHGMPCVVRVPRLDVHTIEQFLNVGVLGILLSKVTSAQMVRQLLQAVKFAPEGRRGAASRSRAANYGLIGSPTSYYERVNRSIVTAALIESQEGIDALDEIAATPGLDCLAIGSNDLALSMEIHTATQNANVPATVEAAGTRIRRAGKAQMTVVGSVEEAQAAARAGVRLIAVSDAALLATAARGLFKSCDGETS